MKNQIRLNIFILGAVAFSLAACSSDSDVQNGDDGANALLDIVAVPAGADCVEGGYSVNTGTDTNGDGVLDTDEITSTSTICNGDQGADGSTGSDGVDGASGLIKKTELPVGDESCPNSGMRFDVGLDNGDGGGIANDGILQVGEIDDFTHVCDGGRLITAKSVLPPEGPVGAFTMNMKGGDGSDGHGGNGGHFNAVIDPGTLTGHIKVFSTGVADASFSFPDSVQTYLGAEPMVVDSDLVLNSYGGGHAGVADGEYHLHDGLDFIYRWDGTSDHVVTGVNVNANETLMFESNDGADVIIRLDNDFYNAGVLSTALNGLNRGGLTILCDSYYGEEGSEIDLRGAWADPGVNGGAGGALSIVASDSDQAANQDWGSIFSHTDVDTTGGQGDDGGVGGAVSYHSYSAIYNSGNISSNGGKGLDDRGANGSLISFYSEFGHILNSGNISSNGGEGPVGGGNAGHINVEINYSGDFKNTGDLIANGGDVDANCLVGCFGGKGGDMYFYGYGGDMITNADLSAHGGFGAAGKGGTGGTIDLTETYNNGWYGDVLNVGDIVFSGNLDISGGDGASGGVAGRINPYIYGEHALPGQEIIFLGYTDILLSGGNGTTLGGIGGNFGMFQKTSQLYQGDEFYNEGPSGGVVNYANIDAHGGNAQDGSAGRAGSFELETEYSYGALTDGEVALNFGDLNLNGGNGTSGGGANGFALMWGYNRVENHGAIYADGGTCSADACSGGSAPEDTIQLLSELGPVISTGDIFFRGGDANGTGYTSAGWGGHIEIVGNSVEISGTLSTSGGSTNTDQGEAGAARDIFIYGLGEGTTSTATYEVNEGEGFEPARHGLVIIDGMNVTDSWYTE